MIFANVGDFKDFLKQDLALQCCRNQNKYFNILTELISTKIKNTTKEIICWAPTFSFQEIVTQKDWFPSLILVLKVSLRLTPIQSGGLFPLRLLPLVIEFCVFMSLQGITPEKSFGKVHWRTTKLYGIWKWGEWKQNDT